MQLPAPRTYAMPLFILFFMYMNTDTDIVEFVASRKQRRAFTFSVSVPSRWRPYGLSGHATEGGSEEVVTAALMQRRNVGIKLITS